MLTQSPSSRFYCLITVIVTCDSILLLQILTTFACDSILLLQLLTCFLFRQMKQNFTALSALYNSFLWYTDLVDVISGCYCKGELNVGTSTLHSEYGFALTFSMFSQICIFLQMKAITGWFNKKGNKCNKNINCFKAFAVCKLFGPFEIIFELGQHFKSCSISYTNTKKLMHQKIQKRSWKYLAY